VVALHAIDVVLVFCEAMKCRPNFNAMIGKGFSWEWAWRGPRFRAEYGPHWGACQAASHGPAHRAILPVTPSERGGCCMVRGGCPVGCQETRSVLSIAGRRASLTGRRRLFARRLRYSPRLGAQAHDRMPSHVADDPWNALQNEGRGVNRLAKSRQPRVGRGADWAPHVA
jgi:hypothetical protein